MTYLVAAVQFMAKLGRAEENRAHILEAIGDAARRGAKVVVLPELAVSGYTLDARVLQASAEEIDGPTLASWTNAARKYGLVIAGGFCEIFEGKLYNSALLVGPDGLMLHYRKLHLFDREKLVFTPGDKGLSVVQTPFGRIGVCVCYDLRFVEVMRALALSGADLVAVPTAWVAGFDKVSRDGDGFIGQARGAIVQANLNQTFVVCASQSHSSGDVRFLGSSLIADPYGVVLGGPAHEEADVTVLAEIDLSKVSLAQSRSELIKPRSDRRTDVYTLTLNERPL